MQAMTEGAAKQVQASYEDDFNAPVILTTSIGWGTPAATHAGMSTLKLYVDDIKKASISTFLPTCLFMSNQEEFYGYRRWHAVRIRIILKKHAWERSWCVIQDTDNLIFIVYGPMQDQTMIGNIDDPDAVYLMQTHRVQLLEGFCLIKKAAV